jgi:4-amino-4-deoxy-L-arabinose transferase-like glycosyltransferase
MPERDLTSRQLRLVLSLALLVRALCWLPGTTQPERFFTDDAHGYVALARDLHAAYLDPQSGSFAVGLVRTPGYPAFLGALLGVFRGSLPAVVAAQVGLSVFTVWLTCVLATRLLGRHAALAGGLLLALDPVSALFSCLLQPETLFTALLLAATLCWFSALERGSWRPAAFAGFMLGIAALIRPIGLFLPLWLAPAVWLGRGVRHKTRLLLCFLLASSVPSFGWMAKNQVQTGFPVFSIGGDSSLFDYRAAGALAEDEGISWEEARTRLWQRLWAMTPPAASAAELGSRQRGLALRILAEHPIGAVKMAARGVARMMAGTGLTALSKLVGDPDPETVSKPWKRAAQALLVLALVGAYLAAFWDVVLLAALRDLLAIALTLGVIAYFALLSAGPEANTRFRFPASPFLAILAGHGLSQVIARSRAG